MASASRSRVYRMGNRSPSVDEPAHRSFRAGWVPTIAAALQSCGLERRHLADEPRREKEERQATSNVYAMMLPARLAWGRGLTPKDYCIGACACHGAFIPERMVFPTTGCGRVFRATRSSPPFVVGDGPMYVAVNRRRSRAPARATRCPVVNAPPGRVTVEGTVMPAQRVYGSPSAISVRSRPPGQASSMERDGRGERTRTAGTGSD